MQQVYFVKCGDAIKIGVSENIRSRLSSLQVGSAQPIELVASVKGDVYLERKFQSRLDEHRISGEWFTDCPDVRAAIKEAVETLDVAPLKYPPTKPANKFGAVCRAVWPLKTAAHLATIAEKDERTAKRWLSGEYEPPAIIIAAIIVEITKRG